ncbi:MAG: AAA domain-containing protein, partial [Candidatus Latescibacteria bacterium]|nr:AAA domain-containing protein [Candidatus Latescibacterota bacterium]
MSTKETPNLGDIQKDLKSFFQNKYGADVAFAQAEQEGTPAGPETEEEPSANIMFNMKPEELEAYLDQYVIRQSGAKEVLATKICTHFNRIMLDEEDDSVGNIKNNIILIGPTGVGKTYLIKLIAKKLGVPFVKGDATKFSETGYVGGDVDDLVRTLVHEADGNIELAQYGIIYIDEID